jgi:acylphosphatase
MEKTQSLRSVHLLVEGQVQGLGYRYFALKTGRSMGILGWVKNLPTGEVELSIEGEDVQIGQYIQTLRSKHPWAQIDNIQENWLPHEGKFQDFRIVYG